MKNKIFIIAFILLVGLIPIKVYSTGNTGAQFLKIGVGARACAMGEAFVALANDPSALYWNPSGISQIQRVQLLASQNFWFLDMSYQYVALVIPSSVGTIGISGAYSSSGKIPKYEDFQRIGDYNAFDIAGTLGYCKNLGILSFGITGKYIQQTIDDVVASGYAFDAGLLFKLSKIFKVGLVVQTIGTEIKFTPN